MTDMPIKFDYDLDESVKMIGMGSLTLRSTLKRIKDRPIAADDVINRDSGKRPAFFDTLQIQALLNRHRSELNEGKPPRHREADEDDF
jgi:hypothetical protein